MSGMNGETQWIVSRRQMGIGREHSLHCRVHEKVSVKIIRAMPTLIMEMEIQGGVTAGIGRYWLGFYFNRPNMAKLER